MTLCPLQFPWDTVPLLPSSSELRGTRLTYQNCFFFFSPEKVWVETMLAQLARAGFRQGAQYESLGKGELCISLTAFHCCEGTQRKVFYQRKNTFAGTASSFLWKLTLTPSSATKQARDTCVPFPCCQTDSRPHRASTAPQGSLLLHCPPIRVGRCCRGKAQIDGKGNYTCTVGLSNQTC